MKSAKLMDPNIRRDVENHTVEHPTTKRGLLNSVTWGHAKVARGFAEDVLTTS